MNSLKIFVNFFLLRIDVKIGFLSSDKFHMNETTESTITYLILFHFGYVSVTEVKQLFRKLKRKKVSGNDHLTPGLHKDSAGVISAPPARIINISFRSGIFLSEWKIAKILPLYKNGATNTFENYRPISVIFKVVGKIIHNRLVDYLSEIKLLSNCKFGIYAKMSTKLSVTLICDDIRKNADSKLLLFIDFKIAFDIISHTKLLQKSNAYGIRNIEYDGFSIYLCNHKQLVNYYNRVFGLLI